MDSRRVAADVTQSPVVLFRGLFEAHLHVANLERAMGFYSHVLGLELGRKEPERRAALYWIGKDRSTMLGLWEKPPWMANGTENIILTQHIAFAVEFGDLPAAIERIKQNGIAPKDFYGRDSDEPSVIGWMPAASIYFSDPDGHLLEFIASIEAQPMPDIGVVSLSEWNKHRRRAG